MLYLLYFFIPLIPLVNITNKIPKLLEGLGFINIMMIVLAIGWVVNNISKGRPIIEKAPLNIPALLFVFITLLGFINGSFTLNDSLIGGDRFTSFKDLMMFPILYFVTLNTFTKKKEIKLLIILILVSMFYMDTYFYREIRWYSLTTYREKLRMFNGTFAETGGSNEWAAFFAQYSMIIYSLYLFSKKDKLKWLYLGVFVMNMAVLLFSFSRGAYLAAFGGLAVIGLLKQRKILPILLLLFVFYTVLLPQSVVQRIDISTEASGKLEESAASRLEYWETAWKLFKDNSLFGVGLFTFGHFNKGRDTHNMYMNVLAEMGILGFSIFMTLFILGIKYGWKVYKTTEDPFYKAFSFGFAVSIFASMMANMFGNRFTPLPLGGYHWVFMGLVMRIWAEEQRNKKQAMKRRKQTVYV